MSSARDTGTPIRPARRRFGARLIAASGATIASPALRGAARARVVVVGGGAGGASTAHKLALGGGDRLDVTLVEPAARYTSCFQSNLYLGGYRSFDALTHGYAALERRHGIRIVSARAVAVDRDARQLRLDDGMALDYDRLVLSPGIDFVPDSVPGWSETDADIAPHAWRGGEQLRVLKAKLDALENGDVVLMVAPPNPYRCPPGPYERASMIARGFERRGLRDCRITILDAKPGFSKQTLFEEGWRRHYPDTIEWIPPDVHGGIVHVDAVAGTVETDLDTFRGTVLNIVPAQRAAAIARVADLVDGSGFCPIDGATMRSTLDARISVIGDACVAGAMPKSAFAAHSQARIVAATLLHELLDVPAPAPRFGNICWSLVADDDSIKVGAGYMAGSDGIETTDTFVSQPSDDTATRAANLDQSLAWYRAITADMFGTG